jgi:hypothetical protein
MCRSPRFRCYRAVVFRGKGLAILNPDIAVSLCNSGCCWPRNRQTTRWGTSLSSASSILVTQAFQWALEILQLGALRKRSGGPNGKTIRTFRFEDLCVSCVCVSVTDLADFCGTLRVADAARLALGLASELDLRALSPAGIEPTFKV